MSEEERNGLIKQRRILREKCEKKDKEIERLHSIIKEVREKVSTLNTTPVTCEDYELRYGDYDITLKRKKELLKILDKKEVN